MAEQGDCYFFPLFIALIKTIIKEISDTVNIEDAIINDRASYVLIPHHLLPSSIKEVATTPCLSDYLMQIIPYLIHCDNKKDRFQLNHYAIQPPKYASCGTPAGNIRRTENT
jgi:hypothetical protein